MIHQNSDIDCWIQGLPNWMLERMYNGWRPYYVNFMFHPLRGTSSGIVAQMHDGICKGFYSRFCTSFVHNPRSYAEQERMPRLMLFPDRPVWKREKKSLREITINGGLHFNGPMLIPPISRFRECVMSHIHEKQSRYCRRGICRIHVTEIHDVPGLIDYATKTLKWNRADPDDILILPKSPSELPGKSACLDPYTRAFKDIQSSLNVSDETAQQILESTIAGQHKAPGYCSKSRF